MLSSLLRNSRLSAKVAPQTGTDLEQCESHITNDTQGKHSEASDHGTSNERISALSASNSSKETKENRLQCEASLNQERETADDNESSPASHLPHTAAEGPSAVLTVTQYSHPWALSALAGLSIDCPSRDIHAKSASVIDMAAAASLPVPRPILSDANGGGEGSLRVNSPTLARGFDLGGPTAEEASSSRPLSSALDMHNDESDGSDSQSGLASDDHGGVAAVGAHAQTSSAGPTTLKRARRQIALLLVAGTSATAIGTGLGISLVGSPYSFTYDLADPINGVFTSGWQMFGFFLQIYIGTLGLMLFANFLPGLVVLKLSREVFLAFIFAFLIVFLIGMSLCMFYLINPQGTFGSYNDETPVVGTMDPVYAQSGVQPWLTNGNCEEGRKA